MNRKQLEEIARKRAPKRPHYLSTPDNDEVTGQDALMLILDRNQSEGKPEPGRPPVVLYLREGVNPADTNFTKYPNDIHLVMLDDLSKEYEGVLYVYLWRQSFGYGRNYCRTSYLEIMGNTLIGSKKTAQRAVSSLVEKHFIVRAKHENGIPNVNQEGALYRVFTPREIQNRTTEEGVSFDDLAAEGVVCQTIPSDSIPHNASINKDSQGVVSEGMVYETIGHTDHTLSDHTSVVPEAIPSLTIPGANSDGNSPEPRHGLTDYSQTDHPFKEESLKDSLSPRAIVSGFYKGIGQARISKEKRERAENNFKELLKDGFDPEDIQFAVEWTLKNAKEELYDFSIIKHTIGQAMVAKRKAEEGEAKRRERERIAAQEEAEEERQERERAEIEASKEKMSSEERSELRQRALEEIGNMKGVKKELITEALIRSTENEILRAGINT